MKHRQINILTDTGQSVMAQAPLIVSASRATDVPAWYADWFFDRLQKGYVAWRNPFSGRTSYVSFAQTRFIVFWSKNPAPLLPHLHKLKQKGIGCYVQFTLNDYEHEGLEPNVPPLEQRIDTFKRLVQELGPGSVVWRFDPMILTDHITIDVLLHKASNVADKLVGLTEKLVFSFADIASYKKVGRNLTAAGIHYREWDHNSMTEFASRLAALNREHWRLELATCSEALPLEQFGIGHNRCIAPELIRRLAPNDATLQNFLYNAPTDSGQRSLCGCILSKDIGAYDTCPHGCIYCYANTSPSSAMNRYKQHKLTPNSETII